MNISDMTILSKAGVTQNSALSGVVSSRGNIIGMAQVAEEAVLRPKDSGAFAHDLRAAIAARVARLAGDERLAAYYAADAGQYSTLADPEETGGQQDELAAVLSFVDKVANQTREAAAEDVAGLQAAGVSDADIVRLCELVAFLAFQVRVIAGLRLMQRESA
ncbi:hypothetical protein [Roseibium album]|uniref:CMD domain protein, family n=1 Tax=Roseibium album TaxID=311410 RepID=A0A0M6ZYG5_9HYPH|nr:hypothetical protein [Roseibium album]CTQ57925.1 CMD domain protein, family [Roseibium album]CTQ67848.1 CMD domain protein, family [Roseibium album]CTQ70285.1 CMD domain protein, family [Roseibium album]